jgi:hypothetical protein
MRGRFRTLVLVAVFAVATCAFPAAVGAAAGLSVAPQAGVPGTQFAVSGAGLIPNAQYSLLVERGMVFGQTFDVTADARGLFRFTLDSTGYAESSNYSVTLFPKGGGATVGATRFAVQASQPERCFAETGFCVRGRFLTYWETHGGLAINGFPLSEVFAETLEDGKTYRVQYFERVRMEHHPENQPPYDILLGQFGRRILAAGRARHCDG